MASHDEHRAALRSVASRYADLLVERYNCRPQCDPQQPFSRHHLHWMLNTLIHTPEMHLHKCHRWLGYVQGVLAMLGVIDVDTERNHTRPYFQPLESPNHD